MTDVQQEMREYMPAPHRRFLETLSELSNVRRCVTSTQADSGVKEAFNAAVMALTSFRDTHLQIVSRYIIMPARSGAANGQENGKVNLATVSSVHNQGNDKGLSGTGGTSLIPFLKQTRDTTKSTAC